MSGTKPNFTGTGNTIKGKEINKWVHKANNKPKPRQKKPTNHSQSQPNPLSLTQPLIHSKETSQAVSLTQSSTEEVPKDHDQLRYGAHGPYLEERYEACGVASM